MVDRFNDNIYAKLMVEYSKHCYSVALSEASRLSSRLTFEPVYMTMTCQLNKLKDASLVERVQTFIVTCRVKVTDRFSKVVPALESTKTSVKQVCSDLYSKIPELSVIPTTIKSKFEKSESVERSSSTSLNSDKSENPY